ncbi:hypothetical protein [Spirosoma sp.]|uniref:hypothetical protein n=1 Tax=Spirosoma sp. TaxID=1899569 RepID=UPI002621C475|nr:hypothetical protein [Spirosoma sp.]MCX6216966.1 hypothetical protein [Spirosoma sp.]
MLPKLEHFPVNWVDGMKIARRHFSEFEHFVNDHLRDSTAVGLNAFNYGLLPSNAPAFNLQVVPESNQNVRVQLFNCRAITGAGCRIEIINDQLTVSTNLNELREKYNLPREKELDFLVVLSVNLFNRKPYGQPSPEEYMARPPFTLPTYQLSIEPSHLFTSRPDIDGQVPFMSDDFESTRLIVGRLRSQADRISKDETYIPACAAVNSHIKLAEWAGEMAKLLAETQRDALEVVRLVCKKRGSDEVKQDTIPLAELIRDWAEQLADHLDEPINQLRFTGRQLPPIYAIEAITLATRRLRTTNSCLNHPDARYGATQMGEEKVLSYFNDWTSIAPSVLRNALTTVIDYPYTHFDVQPQLMAIRECWIHIYRIVHQLTELDYIGQGTDDWEIRRRSVVTNRQNIPRESASSATTDVFDYKLTRPRQ